MNCYGLIDMNRWQFPGVQLEVIRLYRANGALKERLNPDGWVSKITGQGIRTQDDDIAALWVLTYFADLVSNEGMSEAYSSQGWEGEAPVASR
jgi:hypothetical protein